jgi:hypothetical protein
LGAVNFSVNYNLNENILQPKSAFFPARITLMPPESYENVTVLAFEAGRLRA